MSARGGGRRSCGLVSEGWLGQPGVAATGEGGSPARSRGTRGVDSRHERPERPQSFIVCGSPRHRLGRLRGPESVSHCQIPRHRPVQRFESFTRSWPVPATHGKDASRVRWRRRPALEGCAIDLGKGRSTSSLVSRARRRRLGSATRLAPPSSFRWTRRWRRRGPPGGHLRRVRLHRPVLSDR